MGFICPVCGGELKKCEGALKCPGGHSFDIARQGYVNLLRSQKSSAKRHGDDRLMVAARTEFLEKGYYSPLAEAALELSEKYYGGGAILDAGCGECWYTEKFAEKYPDSRILGVDISKAALMAGGRRKCAELAVASLFALPVMDGSVGMVINFFAPLAAEEFHRVLRPGGALIRAVPLERHLYELKAGIYERPYLNEPLEKEIPGFELKNERELEFKIELSSNEQVESLFKMTPYYYKTGREDQARALAINELEVTAHFGLFAYKAL